MPDRTEEISPCARFRMVRLTDVLDGHPRLRIAIELEADGSRLLDLTHAACVVDIAAFDARKPLLHLRLSNAGRSVCLYPATLDLATGLYYHGDPRQAHAPVGHASDLEALTSSGTHPPAWDSARPVRWPSIADPIAPKPEPAPTPAPPPAPPPKNEPEPPGASVSSHWRIDWSAGDPAEQSGAISQPRIVYVSTGEVALDLWGSGWQCAATHVPGTSLVKLSIRTPGAAAVRLAVRIDLDCRYYWEDAGEDRGMLQWEDSGRLERTDGIQAAPLAELQIRLADGSGVVRPALRSHTTGPMWPRWAFTGIAPTPPAAPTLAPEPAPARVPSKHGRPPCSIALMAFTSADDGRAMIHASTVTGDTNEPLVSTLGTRWDLHGHELNGSERILHLHHADDPLLHRSVAVWPAGSASFGDIDECRPAREIEAALRQLDTETRARPRGAAPAKGYTASAPFVIIAQRPIERYFKGEVEYDDPVPVKRPPASEYILETDGVEYAPHRWEDELRLRHPDIARPALDLFGTGWLGSARRDGETWSFDLNHHADPARSIHLLVNPGAATARVRGIASSFHLRFVEMHLASFRLHDDLDAMLKALAAGPTPPDQPSLSIPLGPGPLAPRLEFWPAPADTSDLLQPRIAGPTGIADLDLRGTRFTLSTFQWLRGPGGDVGLEFRLARLNDRRELDEYTTVYRLYPAMRRISRRDIEGSTALSVLHSAAHTLSRAASIDTRLESSLRAGAELPLT